MVEMPCRDVKRSVGAHGLNVAGLLAAVAHTLLRGLGRAVARHVADLAAWERWIS